MAKQFLKEYQLYEDLVRLNHPDYFQITFDTPQTIQHFVNASFDYKSDSGKNSVQFFLKNLQASNDKDVFLVLKWLITTHKIVRKVTNSEILQDIQTTISRMKKPHTPTHIQEYIYSQLIRPYSQYIRKFCFLVSKKFLGKAAKDKQNRISDEELWYVQYNLLRFSYKELTKPCRQFYGFFLHSYPFLSTFAKLLNNDLVSIYRDLKRKASNQCILEIDKEELEGMEHQLSDFQNFKTQQIQFEDEPSMPMKIDNFFSSNKRESRTASSLEDILFN